MNAGGPWEVQIVEFIRDFTYEYEVVGEIKVVNPYPFDIDIDLSIDSEAPRTERIPAGDYSLFSVPTTLGPYEERKDQQDLLRAFGSIDILKVVNASDAAEATRKRKERDKEAERVAKEEARERKRERASDQLSTASEERAERKRNQAEQDKAEIEQANEDARKQRRRLLALGTVATLAGAGGSAALFAVGIPRRTEARSDLARYEDIINPDFTDKAARGRAEKDLRDANSLVALGGVTLGATIVVSALIFRLAGRLKDIDGDSARLQVAPVPLIGPDSSGFGIVGRF